MWVEDARQREDDAFVIVATGLRGEAYTPDWMSGTTFEDYEAVYALLASPYGYEDRSEYSRIDVYTGSRAREYEITTWVDPVWSWVRPEEVS
jgi:hypothetical protein